MSNFSRSYYPGDGTQRDFNVGFAYLSKAHVSVYLNGDLTTSWSWISDSTIRMATAPASGSVLLIRRATSPQARLVDYTAPSSLNEEDLDTDSLQAFYLAQEANDQANAGIADDPSTGQYTAGGKRVTDVADPVDDQDAATKHYVLNSADSQVAQAAASATSAAGSATTATTKATQASASQTAAATSATNAAASATTATTKAGEASASATAAAGSATTANTKASAASSSATAAAGSETSAASSASTANTKAGEAVTSATAASASAAAAAISETNAAASAADAAFKTYGLGTNAPSLQPPALLDDLTVTQFVSVSQTDSLAVNAPANFRGVCLTMGNSAGGSFKHQVYFSAGPGTAPRMWTRQKNATWSAWAEVLTTAVGPVKVTTYTASGTHTYDTRARFRRIRVLGAGGGGGGADTNDNTKVTTTGGGGGGAYVEDFRAIPAATAAIVIGAKGTGGNTSGGNGGNGGTSTYTETGVALSAGGGAGAPGVQSNGFATGWVAGGGIGGSASGGNVINLSGNSGGYSLALLQSDARTFGLLGDGAAPGALGVKNTAPFFGNTSGALSVNGDDAPASWYGTGGTGAGQTKTSGTGATGGNGAGGLCIVEEFF